MQAILEAMRAAAPALRIVVFQEDTLLNAPVSEWPRVDALIAFYSRGFPLQKTAEFAAMTRPFLLNDLALQSVMRDRAAVYAVLQRAAVPQPNTVICNRERGDRALLDGDTLVVVKSQVASPSMNDKHQSQQLKFDHLPHGTGSKQVSLTMRKPFVEKPLNADDHNVYVYYPGHVVQQLFRKTANACSILVERLTTVRTRGSYLYQEFHQPHRSMDIKVYAVGGDYFYAVARKAPTVDGLVERTKEGLEVRYRVLLTDQEVDMCTRVCRAFKQFVIGFDILRADNTSYIIDVNGWSFVKDSTEFLAMCGRRIAFNILNNVGTSVPIPVSAKSGSDVDSDHSHAYSPCSP